MATECMANCRRDYFKAQMAHKNSLAVQEPQLLESAFKTLHAHLYYYHSKRIRFLGFRYQFRKCTKKTSPSFNVFKDRLLIFKSRIPCYSVTAICFACVHCSLVDESLRVIPSYNLEPGYGGNSCPSLHLRLASIRNLKKERALEKTLYNYANRCYDN